MAELLTAGSIHRLAPPLQAVEKPDAHKGLLRRRDPRSARSSRGLAAETAAAAVRVPVSVAKARAASVELPYSQFTSASSYFCRPLNIKGFNYMAHALHSDLAAA